MGSIMALLIWIKKMKAKIVKKQPGIIVCAANLQQEEWSFRMAGL